MTIRQIIERVDRMKPNGFDTLDKLRWISELDGHLALEVCMMDIQQVQEFAYTEECLDHEPLAQFPHDGMYEHWLGAKIDYANGEYDKYQNGMEHYNACFEVFRCWFLNTYDPVQGYEKE